MNVLEKLIAPLSGETPQKEETPPEPVFKTRVENTLKLPDVWLTWDNELTDDTNVHVFYPGKTYKSFFASRGEIRKLLALLENPLIAR